MNGLQRGALQRPVDSGQREFAFSDESVSEAGVGVEGIAWAAWSST